MLIPRIERKAEPKSNSLTVRDASVPVRESQAADACSRSCFAMRATSSARSRMHIRYVRPWRSAVSIWNARGECKRYFGIGCVPRPDSACENRRRSRETLAPFATRTLAGTVIPSVYRASCPAGRSRNASCARAGTEEVIQKSGVRSGWSPRAKPISMAFSPRRPLGRDDDVTVTAWSWSLAGDGPA